MLQVAAKSRELHKRAEPATVKTFLRRNSNLDLNLEPQVLFQQDSKISMDTTMADAGASSNRQGQVQVHFITNSPDIELPEGKRQLLVPTSEYNSQSQLVQTGWADKM